MNEEQLRRLVEIGQELYQLLPRPDVYALVIVDSSRVIGEDNTHVMSNLTMNDTRKFLRDISLNLMKPET